MQQNYNSLWRCDNRKFANIWSSSPGSNLSVTLMCLDVYVQVLSCKLFYMPVVSVHVVHCLTSTGRLAEKGLNWKYLYLPCILDNLTIHSLDFHQNKRVFHVISQSSLNTWPPFASGYFF